MRPERGIPPVEPLSRQAWERVEARVFERLGRGEHLPGENVVVRGPAPVRVWLGAAALVLVATVLLWWSLDILHHDHPAANASIAPPISSPLVVPLPLTPKPPSDTVQVSAPRAESTRIVSTLAPARTTLGDAAVTLAAHSDVSVSGSEQTGWVVDLAAGRIECDVAPRRDRPAFVVQAGDARVSVVGTAFSVERSGASARVSVREGLVHVDSGTVHVELGAGEQWPAAGAPAAVAEPSLRAPRKARASARDRAQARFDEAAALEVSDPNAAARIYSELAATRGPWAANALYAQARLALEQGKYARAKRLLESYEKRHPRGVNARDARALLEQLPR